MFNLIEDALDTIGEFIGGFIEISVEVISDIVAGVIDAVGAFLDWLFGDCGNNEESSQSC